ncbi:MAG: NAD(P)-dependent oxidoreductase [Pseudomonadales bacterium]|nr:NAD(P)-dependent oxidoreductase [Pseudomonadales bacterium]
MRIGFIGLGTQGKPLALNIAAADFELTVFDIRQQPLTELANAGAQVAATPSELATNAEIIIICVLDDEQLEAVVLGPEGIFKSINAGTIVAIHSTVNPATIDNISDQAKALDVSILDAPVSGGDAGAKRKAMSYMVGGDLQALEKCRPVFEASGNKITHTGDAGTGIRAKLAHQLIICINILAAAEGMDFGVKAGVAPEVLEKIVSEGAAQSRMADHWSKLNLGQHSQEVFYKDLQVCLKYAHDLGISLPGAALTQQLLSKIVT